MAGNRCDLRSVGVEIAEDAMIEVENRREFDESMSDFDVRLVSNPYCPNCTLVSDFD